MQKMIIVIVSLEIIHLRAFWCTLRHQVNWHLLIWNTIEIAQTIIFTHLMHEFFCSHTVMVDVFHQGIDTIQIFAVMPK